MPKKKTHEEFVQDLKIKNPAIIPLGTYIKSNKPIFCRCSVCGHEWSPIANNILRQGCPQCAGNIKRTHEQFVREMSVISPSLEIIGYYETNKSIIDCKTF